MMLLLLLLLPKATPATCSTVALTQLGVQGSDATKAFEDQGHTKDYLRRFKQSYAYNALKGT